MMNLIIHMSNTSMIPYISLDQYLNPNLYTIPNMQNMRFFCCSVNDQSMPTLLQKQSDLCLHCLSSSGRLAISFLKFRTFTVYMRMRLFVCLFVYLLS